MSLDFFLHMFPVHRNIECRAHEVWLRHCYAEVKQMRLVLRCLSLELTADDGVIVHEVSKAKNLNLEVTILCNSSEARFLETAWERLSKTSLIRGSSSSLSS